MNVAPAASGALFYGGGPFPSLRTETDGFGRAFVYNADPGTLRLTATKPDVAFRQVQVEVRAEAVTVASILPKQCP